MSVLTLPNAGDLALSYAELARRSGRLAGAVKDLYGERERLAVG